MKSWCRDLDGSRDLIRCSGRMEILRPPRQTGTAKSLCSVQFGAALPVQAGMRLD